MRRCFILTSLCFLCTTFYGTVQAASVSDSNDIESNDNSIEKGDCRGPRGHRGERGHHGEEGDRGHKGEKGHKGRQGDPGVPGATGAIGATGPAGTAGATGPQGATGALGPTGVMGPTGQAGPIGIGVAQTYTPTATGATGSSAAVISRSGIHTVLLNQSAISTTTTDFFFNSTPTDAFFQINKPGNYFIGYGLSCLANSDLTEDWIHGTGSTGDETVAAWIAIQKVPAVGAPTLLGAVPLAATWTRTAVDVTGANTPMLLSAYGQMQTALNNGDKIRLVIRLDVSETPSAEVHEITIASGSIINDPLNPSAASVQLNNGGTLTLIRIP